MAQVERTLVISIVVLAPITLEDFILDWRKLRIRAIAEEVPWEYKMKAG